MEFSKLPALLRESSFRGSLRRRSLPPSPPSFSLDTTPVTPEILGADQLVRYAKALAASHVLDPASTGGEDLLERLDDNEQVIREAHGMVAAAAAAGQRIGPAAEWLLDNFYLIEEQIRLARRHLPRAYSRQLPRLRVGAHSGPPRVYAITVELISHSDGRVDLDNLQRFIEAYQTGASLRLGELWAVPIMLRLALVENMRQATERIAARRRDRDLAGYWAAKFLELARNKPRSMVVALGDLVRSEPPMTRPFLVELATQLQGQHAALGLVIQWLEQELAEHGQAMEQVLRIESQDQATDQASFGNSVNGLRALSTIDWRQFVESQSVTEAWLRRDPLGAYAGMSFYSRDRYRHVVELLAKRSGHDEVEVARQAVLLARQRLDQSNGNHDAPTAQTHVGYYLVGPGRQELEKQITYRVPWHQRVRRATRRAPGWFYLGFIVLLTALLTRLMLAWLPTGEALWPLAIVAVLSLFVASQPALLLVNWLVTLLTPPRLLPRMDFSTGIPDQFRTVVAVPGMLSSPSAVHELVDNLELRFLANRDANLFFVLLTDFPDAAEQTLPGDEPLLSQAAAGIEALNQRYARGGNRFYLLHRPRRWNEAEGVWMGYERKRGKLEQFNALLRSGNAEPFSRIVGDPAALRQVRCVIVLDADTQLPPQCAWKLVGAMAHPLNRPVVDTVRRRVVSGYGILQPRVSVALGSADRSRYTRLYSVDAGIDPYSNEVSDVYYDVFAEASFMGKGIYDVEAFSACLADRLPQNTVLSHDLLEGSYARCGFVSDVELLEDYPSRFTADAGRRHRWVRGDWQILPWLARRVPAADTQEANPLTTLSRWKIFDNLRRSLLPAALLALWLVVWIFFPRPNLFVGVSLAILILPKIARTASSFIFKSRESSWLGHGLYTLRQQAAPLAQFALSIIFLPYEAALFLDAIARVSWRKLVTRRRLLEWCVSTDVERSARIDLPGLYRAMWMGSTAGALLAAAVVRFPAAWPTMLPLAVIWTASPMLAWWLSQPIVARRFEFSEGQRAFLGKLARRTWRYFELYAGPRTHWLAPDNIQEAPRQKIAERTSPTNMGLGLLAGLSAYDFGYLSAPALVERTDQALTTLEKLERFRGHFLNWYDTQTCQTLSPRYVSMVDSGNLAGALLTLAGGMEELCRAPILAPRWLAGIRDAAEVLLEELRPKLAADGAAPLEQAGSDCEKIVQGVLRAALGNPQTQYACQIKVDQLRSLTGRLHEMAATFNAEIQWWIQALHGQVVAAGEQLAFYLPSPPPSEADLHRLGQMLSETHADPALVQELLGQFREIPHFDQIVAWRERFAPLLEIALRRSSETRAVSDSLDEWLARARLRIDQASQRAARQIDTWTSLRQRCIDLSQMDFAFLFDPARKLFAIGYQVDHRRLDPGYYDLLASEARLGSYVAIARGQAPLEHWFMLSRTLTPVDGGATLVSWSGSMFEYLMPLLLMPSYAGTLLDQANKLAIQGQIEYGRENHVPWGISESCYNLFDAQQNYQYRAFGVPALGLRRGLASDLVVAPYATTMALMVKPQQAIQNMHRMADEGWMGSCGFFESVDFTTARVPAGQHWVVVRSFMAHHSGMSLLSLEYALLGQPMQRRFVADPELRANLLLLQERAPIPQSGLPRFASAQMTEHEAERPLPMRTFTSPHTPTPAVGLYSNGHYHAMLTNAGGGYSRWNDLALTRWREDGTQDTGGFFCYLRDLDRGRVWSTTYHPTAAQGEKFEAIFMQARAECRRVDDRIETHLQVSVSPEDDVEVRQITLTNLGERRRRIELTSYAEVVLAPAATDAAHRVFSNLFVQTQILRDVGGIVCTRRPRAAGEKPPWMFHAMVLPEGTSGGSGAAGGAGASGASGGVSYETDRARFIGRGRTVRNPQALETRGPLSGSEGAVLDPIVAIRGVVEIEPGQSVEVYLVMGAAASRDALMTLLEKYRDRRLTQRVFETAWAHSQIVLQQLAASEADAQLYSRLASSLLFAGSALRASPAVVARNRRGQPALWGYAISGDLPIVLLELSGADGHLDLVRQLIQAHAYWRTKLLLCDLVILVEDQEGYRQRLFDAITGLVAASAESGLIDKAGGIFVRNAEQMPEADRILLESTARIVVNDRAGSLADQAKRFVRSDLAPRTLRVSTAARSRQAKPAPAPRRELAYFNGLGGFTIDGREYVITLNEGAATPAPWSNVLANGVFGSVISESGGAYTWFENAHEFRLTPWHNDPVSDASGEAFYIRDDATGRFWSPTPLPARGSGPYVVRHGLGYTIFEHQEGQVRSELTTYVAADAPLKFMVLKLRNLGEDAVRLSVSGYWEWVLGEMRDKTAMHVVTQLDPKTGALLASCPFNPDFAQRIAFAHCEMAGRTFTGDRAEFIGRNGSLANPAAMRYQRLSNRTGAAFDPCAAIQAPIELGSGEEREIVFLLGAGRSEQEVAALLQRFRGPGDAHQALEEIWALWKRMLGTVSVETPDASVNFLVNCWLPYQTIACRLWGRSGYYQSGGAFGFRDQLQDAMAMLIPCSWLLREQILAAAAHQFREGDVQHWWHPPAGRGVRTQISDDYLWLPYATARYVMTTNDTGILDQEVAFLEDRQLRPGEDSYYARPEHSGGQATLYEHCLRAIDHGLRFGAHGLPLMGSGDWNDGMNRVGHEGKGESVWLAFFLSDVLEKFVPVAALRHDQGAVERFKASAAKLRADIEANAWDGHWYRRAYFDNGAPLGSAENPECQIDSLPQSWAVLAGAKDESGSAAASPRAIEAMNAVDQRLVRRDLKLIALLDPPFDQSDLDPGYIKGYVPGVRENGGQYTHAAIWVAMARGAMHDAAYLWEYLGFLNPIRHTASSEGVAKYKTEPYVMTADIYTAPAHAGRGGWSWYTGSAGWMYRLLLETLLGLRIDVDRLTLSPVLPAGWTSFKIFYRFRLTLYEIHVKISGNQTWSIRRVEVDGVEQLDKIVHLVDDRQDHQVMMEVG